jgi:hypothetical protein
MSFQQNVFDGKWENKRKKIVSVFKYFILA